MGRRFCEHLCVLVLCGGAGAQRRGGLQLWVAHTPDKHRRQERAEHGGGGKAPWRMKGGWGSPWQGSGWLVEELALSQTLRRLVELGQAEVEGGAPG